jgi:hypothetical protein
VRKLRSNLRWRSSKRLVAGLGPVRLGLHYAAEPWIAAQRCWGWNPCWIPRCDVCITVRTRQDRLPTFAALLQVFLDGRVRARVGEGLKFWQGLRSFLSASMHGASYYLQVVAVCGGRSCASLDHVRALGRLHNELEEIPSSKITLY